MTYEFKINTKINLSLRIKERTITGRYMQLALRTARTFCLKKIVKWSAVRPAPAPAGGSRWCHGFCQRENKVITA